MSSLTERDLLLFRMIESQGIVTLEQTLGSVFANIEVAKKRVSKLLKNGVLESTTIEDLSKNVPQLKDIYDLRLIGLKRSKRCYTFGEGLRRIRKTVLEPEILKHNLLTNYVFNSINVHLESEIKGFQFEKEVRSKESQYIPDITFIGKNFKLGIEVERTLKRDRTRYYMKFFKLQESKYTHILYVCLDREIEKAVHKLAKTMPFIGTTVLTEELRVISHSKSLKDFLSESYHEN